MRNTTRFLAASVIGLSGAWMCYAQDDGNSPPEIRTVTWEVSRDLTGSPFSFDNAPFVPFDPDNELARELDILRITVDIFDADFAGDGDDQIFVAQASAWLPVVGYPSPEPPTIPEDDTAFKPEDGEGFTPQSGQVYTHRFFITIPEFNGKNQARLRGIVDFDVRWLIVFNAWNDQSGGEDPEDFRLCPAPDEFTFTHCQILDAIENPVLAPPNPPAFADAGAAKTVAAGTTVQLDGSRTFDGFNVGFNPDNQNVFEKDTIVYTWEWISGPERVEPIYRDLANKPAIAEVTLNVIGTYVYRLVVDDGVNRLPTADSVIVEVVSAIPVNRPPTALIDGPAAAVVVGSLISLDGTRSFDPDGDVLSFRWKQTDELGGEIPVTDIDRFFQPVSGLESPIVVWQAVAPGTFHFRLLVSDASFSDSERIAVEVVEAPTAGAIATNNGASRDEAGPPADGESAQNTALPACGAGLLPVALVPFCLLLMRRRHG